MSTIAQLRDLILKAKHAYYYSAAPIMSDAEYDALEDELRQLAPDDPVLALIGSPVPPNTMLTKARHRLPMGSQSKVNSETEFRQWALKSGPGGIHASLKGDGASAAAYYLNGRLIQAISRGDGTIGEDITANALRFQGLPAWAGDSQGGFTGAVRFEVILTLEEWTRIDPARSKNPRNVGSGIMGRKNGHQSDALTIFAFDIDESREDGLPVAFRTESDKAKRLEALGFNLIPQQHCATTEEAVAYFNRVADTRHTLPFWIDGVVMKMEELSLQNALGSISGRPRGQVAWKFDSAGIETVVEGVLISGGHTGALIPTAQLRPVEIGGTTVSSASLTNFDEINRLDLAIGDTVWLIKANDIIPKIVRVTQRPARRQPILAPTRCPFCGGHVGRRKTTEGCDGAILVCQNRDCPKKSIGKIKRWITSLDIQGIGDVILEALVEHFELEDAADLYALQDRAVDMAQLVTHPVRGLTLGAKRAASILAAIDAKRSLTLSEFLGSLGLEHLGKRRVEIMMDQADGLLDTLEDWRSGKLRSPDVAEKAGAPHMGAAIQDSIDAIAPVIDKMLANGVDILPPQRDVHASENAPARKTVCISGRLPSGKKKSDYAQALQRAGYELVDNVHQGLDYLVLAEAGSTSQKAVKARQWGVDVISEEDLINKIEDSSSNPAPILPSTAG